MDSVIRHRDLASNKDYECFVVAFAQSIIRATNKTDANGYFAIPEYHVRAFNVASCVSRADVVIIELIFNERVVLVIECKVNEDDLDEAEDQLRGYMRDLDCNHGMTMTANTAVLYARDNRRIQNLQRYDLNNTNEIQAVINWINSI